MRIGFGIFKNSATIPRAALPLVQRPFSSVLAATQPLPQLCTVPRSTLALRLSPNYNLLAVMAPSLQQPAVRTLTKFSRQSGKRKSVKAVLKRFKRLDWGAWIRTKSGRHKKLWKKSPPQKRRLRQHVFTNSTQSYLLDKMVTSFWRRPKNYIDDPYKPYHTREEFYVTKRKA